MSQIFHHYKWNVATVTSWAASVWSEGCVLQNEDVDTQSWRRWPRCCIYHPTVRTLQPERRFPPWENSLSLLQFVCNILATNSYAVLTSAACIGYGQSVTKDKRWRETSMRRGRAVLCGLKSREICQKYGKHHVTRLHCLSVTALASCGYTLFAV